MNIQNARSTENQHSRRRQRLAVCSLALLGALGLCTSAYAGTQQDFRGIHVEVVGQGRPVVMIPGYNSSGSVWKETCAALQADQVQCHILTLPGFAGQPVAKDASKEAWIEDMGNRVMAYVRQNKLSHPIVIGHSLGGFMALDMNVRQPGTFDKIVIVDSLPFFSAAFNPMATSESAKPMATGMRNQLLNMDDAAYRASLPANLQGMTNDASRNKTLSDWSMASDRGTSAEAIYELMTRDLRGEISKIKVPTLVLGAWAAYAQKGGKKGDYLAFYQMNYQMLSSVQVKMSEGGYHFLMWDDPKWLQAEVRTFINATPIATR